MLTQILLLDIETVPQCESLSGLDSVWQALYCEKISKTVPEGSDMNENYTKKAGILAEFGKIVCISTAFFSTDKNGRQLLKMKSIYGNDEVEILRAFTELCNKMYQHNRHFQFGGHNIREFDIPFICRRLIINRLPLPEFLCLHDKKPWEVKMFDTLSWWKFGDYKNYISLHLLAAVLGIPTSKTDMDGSMVYEVYYKQNGLARIVDYCQRDVVVTANIILRFRNQSLLSEEQVVIV